jgi:hypothetical protein
LILISSHRGKNRSNVWLQRFLLLFIGIVLDYRIGPNWHFQIFIQKNNCPCNQKPLIRSGRFFSGAVSSPVSSAKPKPLPRLHPKMFPRSLNTRRQQRLTLNLQQKISNHHTPYFHSSVSIIKKKCLNDEPSLTRAAPPSGSSATSTPTRRQPFSQQSTIP